MTGRLILAACAVCVLSAVPAVAQVRYAPQSRETFDFFSPYDESYGTSPSYEIYPRGYGQAPAVRVVERCQYPDGWNVTDFSRDVNGIPAGIDHTCRQPPRVRGRR